MVTKKKAAAKKKASTKKAVATKKPRVKAIKEPYTRTALFGHLSEKTGLTKKEIASVFDELKVVIEGHIKKGSAQVFTLPGILKVKVNRKPATRARKGTNPFTGEEMVFKAKPARNVVKVQPLKALKDMAS
ncbi:MAG TPA: DNA-binding protein [Chromatiales bacterium]|nr:DNA-binding protein [Chromatiales bacterium]